MKKFCAAVIISICAAAVSAHAEMPMDVFAECEKQFSETRQIVVVEPKGKKISGARVETYEKKDGAWVSAGGWDAVVGGKGIAAYGAKKEGDMKTPSGIYALGLSFGYGNDCATGLDYRQITEDDKWVDDPDSPQYNQWVRGRTSAKSFEKLKRSDDLYKYFIVIEYNTKRPVKGKGSAIFAHVWKGPDSGTAGCVAMPEKDIVRLLAWLDKSKRPVMAILTAR